jgi:radical SAM superfamily enzyme YgiQ (UPF0313 family)
MLRMLLGKMRSYSRQRIYGGYYQGYFWLKIGNKEGALMKVMVLVPPSKFSKNVARDLIYGCWCRGKRIAGTQFPPISQLMVATILKQDGNNTILYDAPALGKGIEDIRDEVSKGYNAVVALTSTMTINEDSQVFKELKLVNPNLKVIVYGAHPTFMPKQTLSRKSIDVAVQREPEFIIRDLIRAFEKKDGSFKRIKGIAFREDGNILINEPFPFIENLDILPIPDRAILPIGSDYFNPIVKRVPFTTMFTSRGCLGRCVFCSSPSFYGRVFRFQSAQRVVKEMEEIQCLGYKEVFFRDEIFTASKKRVMDICEKILERKIELSWICSARIGTVDLETMKLMKEAGCHMIRFGVESGVQRILNNIKKDITVEQIRTTFEWIHRAGLDTHAHLMIGMPGETGESIQKSIEFAREIDPTIITVGICTPFPGTELFEEIAEIYPEIGDGSGCDLGKLHTKAFYNQVFTNMKEADLPKYIRHFYRSFYLRPSYVIKWFKRIKSLDELRRIILAATQVFDFVFRGD